MRYVIEQEQYLEDPRKEWDHACTMVCWHRRSNLGDETITDLAAWKLRLVEEAVGSDWMAADVDHDDCDYGEDPYNDPIGDHINAVIEKHYYMENLYLYEHSGMTMSLAPFSCPWDSGQVGFIYISRKDALKECGNRDVDEWVDAIMKSEVNEYDMYLRGDVWSVIIEDDRGEILEASGGFFGHDYAEEEAKRMLEYCRENSFDPCI